MFEHYEIKYENEEEILYLYLNYDYEFANLDINSKVKQYISNMKIKFNGIKVVIVVGGIIIGTLLLNDVNLKKTSPEFVPITYEIKNDIIFNKPLKINNSISNQVVSKESVNVSKKDTNETLTIEKVNVSKENTSEIKTSEKKEANNKNLENNKGTSSIEKTMVTVLKSNGTVLNIELEEYLIGVVGSEMPASFNIEALKAQAVVARTYTLKKLQNNQALSDTVKDQVYKDNFQLKEMWGSSYNTYYEKIKKAVKSTEGEFITYNNEYIEAVYHSTSNGYTEESSFVWKNSFPYLISVESPWDLDASTYLRKETKSIKAVSDILGVIIDENTKIEVLDTTSGNRISKIKIGDKVFDGVKFRNLLGLRSTDFDIEINNDSITFTTRGYGHGVGMSQYGANGMAKTGYNYSQIIHHYYKNVTIKK